MRVCRSSSCFCYPFSATLPWRQCPPGVMGDECARAIYSLFLPPSLHPLPSLFVCLSLSLSLYPSLSLSPSLPSSSCNLSVSPLSISLLPLFVLPLSDWLNTLLLKARYCLMRQGEEEREGDKEQESQKREEEICGGGDLCRLVFLFSCKDRN